MTDFHPFEVYGEDREEELLAHLLEVHRADRTQRRILKGNPHLARVVHADLHDYMDFER